MSSSSASGEEYRPFGSRASALRTTVSRSPARRRRSRDRRCAPRPRDGLRRKRFVGDSLSIAGRARPGCCHRRPRRVLVERTPRLRRRPLDSTRALPRQQLVQHDAERVDIGRCRDRVVQQLFRRCVLRCQRAESGFRPASHCPDRRQDRAPWQCRNPAASVARPASPRCWTASGRDG